ncbi:MAG: M14 family metallopeptidase [Eubacteriales bacterium]|nr:M14 family metallopeptidase [Eubacteriales bacterium]
MSDPFQHVKLCWMPDMRSEERRFAVELAHLIGFHAVAMEFPVLERAAACEDTLYFCVCSAPCGAVFYSDGFSLSRQNNVVGVRLNGRAEAAYRFIAENYVGLTGITSFSRRGAIEGYAAASDAARPMRPRYDRAQIGLEGIFETGLLLFDDDNDGLPDRENVKFLLPDTLGYGRLSAMCDLAARFGMETTGIEYPLLADADDGEMNLVRFEDGGRPGIRLERDGRVNAIVTGGEDAAAFMAEFAGKFPLAAEETSLTDCAERMIRSLRMGDLDGQTAALLALGERAVGATCGFSPKVEEKRAALERRWPHTAFSSYIDLEEVTKKSFELEWEVEKAECILREFLLPLLKKGDRVELYGALSEDKPVRGAFIKTAAALIEGEGAALENAEVLCAYKQGFSWLEERVAPRLMGSGVKRIEVGFKPFLRPGVTDWGDENGASPSYATAMGDPARWFDLPLRYLQELFPIDDVIAPELGIDRNDIVFEAYEGGEDITYRVRAYGAAGELILEDFYKAAYEERPYLDLYPEMGLVHPATGFLRAKVNGGTVLDCRVKTDLESIWDVYQSEVLPYCKGLALCGGAPSAAMQPFFAQMRLDITASEPERLLAVREDRVDPLNALHEDIYFAGLDMFKVLGLNTSGEKLDAPGLFLPVIRKAEGRPKFMMTHYRQRFKEPVIELKDGGRVAAGKSACTSAVISAVYLESEGLALVFDVNADESAAPMIAAYAALCGEGFAEMAHYLNGYGRLVLRHNNRAYTAVLPKETAAEKDMDIGDVDIMERSLIGYAESMRVIEQLKRVRGISVYRAGETYRGRDIYAVRLLPSHKGYVSRVKLITKNPVELVNARHHANEVSGTNAVFITLKAILTDKAYEGLGDELNLVFIPFENADGAAIHYELQKDHPTWKLHIARYNALGKEFYWDYFDVDTIHTEAFCIRDHYYRWLPDVFADCHGVPSHEWEQQFSGYTSPWFKGFWLPRALLYGYFWYISDTAYRFNERLNRQWADAVAEAMLQDGEISAWNADWRDRHEKYAHRWMPKLFPADYYKNMINYWVPSTYNPKHGYMAVRFPWITSVSYTAEVADETAQGDYLYLCARTHAMHLLAGIALLRGAGCIYEETTEGKEEGLQIRAVRKRPIISLPV